MSSGDYYTWNPQVHFQVVGGAIGTEDLASRTLSISYVDRLRKFDHIEWELDNRDGVLTHPEYIAAGLVVRLRMGYIDGAFPWKSFIINKLNGGVGVFDDESSPVGDNESKIKMFGRNRNAPGGSLSRGWSHRSSGGRSRGGKSRGRKGGKTYGPTSDITQSELLLSNKDLPRIIKAHTTSDAVRRIAERNGFTDKYARIEETRDHIDSGYLAIPDGMADGTWLDILARDRGSYEFKVTDGVLHWHSVLWAGAADGIAARYTYGHGKGILKMTLQADFRLPAPTSVKAAGVNFKRRIVTLEQVDTSDAQTHHGMGRSYMDMVKDVNRTRALTREDIIPVIITGEHVAKDAAVNDFIAKHRRTIGLRVDFVGNPDILAGRYIDINGTNCPFVDRTWAVAEAKHVNNGTTYQTHVKLVQPPNHMDQKSSGNRVRGTLKNKNPKPAAAPIQDERGYFYMATVPPASIQR